MFFICKLMFLTFMSITTLSVDLILLLHCELLKQLNIAYAYVPFTFFSTHIYSVSNFCYRVINQCTRITVNS